MHSAEFSPEVHQDLVRLDFVVVSRSIITYLGDGQLYLPISELD